MKMQTAWLLTQMYSQDSRTAQSLTLMAVDDVDADEATHYGGYVRLRKDDEAKCFCVTIVAADGDIITETEVPYKFIPVEEL
jgi:hypothetical protein